MTAGACEPRVLLVDDEVELLAATERVLRRRGLQVETARSGEEGLERLRAAPFDVVVLDVKMPGIGGEEVVRRLRLERPALPIIVLTGCAEASTELLVDRAGVLEVLTKPADADLLAARIRAAAHGPAAAPPGPATVLLVDDEVELLDSLARVLRRRGFAVESAPGAEAALAMVARKRFGAVVLDVKMPGMDGLEALERVKALRPDQEVILLSGHPSVENAAAGVKLGAMDYVTKPVEVPRLVELLERAVGRGGPKPARSPAGRTTATG